MTWLGTLGVTAVAVVKDAWERTLTVDGQALQLQLSDDARAMLWVMPWTLLCAAAGTRRPRHNGYSG